MLILQTFIMIALTVITYLVAKKLQEKYKHPLLNPALISSLFIIIILLIFSQDYNDYMTGGKWINYLLNSTVVCLAYPLYKNRKMILQHANIIFTSVIAAVVINFFLLFITLKLMGYSKEVIVTLLPRSITAAVGIELSDQLGGTDTITVMFIICTGLIGSILGAYLLKLAKFQTSIARGLAYGNSSHAFGTAKALELDIESGAFSSIGMILNAILSSVIIPLLLLLLY
ncbi:LrgB family protein [Helicobacter pylori]